MTKEYQIFEEGFIKGATALGVEEPFMRGYLKYAQEVTDTWIPYVNAAAKASGDPDFRVKLAADIILLGKKQALEKCAGLGDELGNIDWMGMLDSLGGKLGGSSGLGGLLAGGGGGSLIGLLLSKALGISPYLGLLLGGALGGGAGYQFGTGGFGQTPAAGQQVLNGTAVPSPQGGGEPPAGQPGPTGAQGPDTEALAQQPGKAVTPPSVPQASAPQAPSPTPKLQMPPPKPTLQPPTGMGQLGKGTNAPQAPGMPKPVTPPPAPLPKTGAFNIDAILKNATLNISGMGQQAQEPGNQQQQYPGQQPKQQPQTPSGNNPGDIDADTIALLQHMLSSRQYNEEAAAGGQHVVPSQITVGQAYNKDQGALNRLKDMGADNPEKLMNPPEKPKFNISQAFNSGHGSQQHVNTSPAAPGNAKPMQPAKPGPLGFSGSNLQQGSQALAKNTQKALKASV